jgi:hypothetical protein
VTEPERAVWNALETGALVKLPLGAPTAEDPATGEAWGDDRQIRAQLLYQLLTGGNRPEDVRPRALRLAGARISGTLDLDGAELVCPLLLRDCWLDEPVTFAEARAVAIRLPGCYLPALQAEQLVTRVNLELDEGFTSQGEVSLLGAHVGGVLSLMGATLTDPNGCALNADGLTVDGHMLCREGFTAQGEINLLSAHIGGSLDLRGATLTNPNGCALNANRLTVDQSMYCGDRFTAEGEVSLVGVHIGGQLALSGATLTKRDGCALDLEAAHVATLVENEASWPNRLRLDGFVYDALFEDPPVTATARLDWLARNDPGYAPQPYEQLTAVYRRAGRDEDARTIAIGKQRRRRATLKPPAKAWNSLLRWTVGYGYRPWQAGLWLAALLLIGTMVFATTHAHGQITPAKKPQELQHFNPLIYALDVLLPIVNLGQEGGWVPHRAAAVCFWLLALAGWVLTTTVVAALTGLIKRD